MSDQAATLAEALARLQAKLPRIAKSETAQVPTKAGGTYSYTYAGLADISAQVLPLLAEVGLAFTAAPAFEGERFVLRCSLLHVSGQREDAHYPLPASGTPQSVGSAITYGRRYCLCAMTGVAPEDDDDGAAAEAERAGQRGTAQRTQPRQRPAQAARPAAAEATAQRAQPRQSPPPLPDEQRSGESMITEPQQKKIAVQMRELGIDTRDLALERVHEIIGRRVESRSELTRAEAKSVIEALDGPPPAPEEVGADA